MLTLKALGLVLVALAAIWALWFLTCVFAYLYLYLGHSHPRPGWGFTLARKIFASIAEDVERNREVLEPTDKIMRKGWWPFHLVLLVLFCLGVLVVRHFLGRAAL